MIPPECFGAKILEASRESWVSAVMLSSIISAYLAEGSLTVALAGGAGVALAELWTGAAAAVPVIACAGLLAALAEAAAPRATDNLLVPAAVFLFLTDTSGGPP